SSSPVSRDGCERRYLRVRETYPCYAFRATLSCYAFVLRFRATLPCYAFVLRFRATSLCYVFVLRLRATPFCCYGYLCQYILISVIFPSFVSQTIAPRGSRDAASMEPNIAHCGTAGRHVWYTGDDRGSSPHMRSFSFSVLATGGSHDVEADHGHDGRTGLLRAAAGGAGARGDAGQRDDA